MPKPKPNDPLSSADKASVKKSTVRRHLRLLTYNMWHGLDHSQPKIMLPAETPWDSRSRARARVRGLRDELLKDEEALTVFLLQEANPADRMSPQLQRQLGTSGELHFPINTGLRVGPLSYPFFLQEGLSTLWNGKLSDLRYEKKFLSGSGVDFLAFGGIPFSFHAQERRGALLLHASWHGKRFSFVNLHLHSGRPHKSSDLRRASELDTLLQTLEKEFQHSDAIFIGGDFNCEQGQEELAGLMAKGFQEFLPSNKDALNTWDPLLNPLCRRVSQMTTDKGHREWDAQVHQLDHIYFWWKASAWGKKPASTVPWTVSTTKVFDHDHYGVWMSDHIGIRVDLSWEESL